MGPFAFRSTLDNHHHQYLDASASNHSNPSLISQPSLPSVPTLTLQPSKHFDQPLTTLKSHTSSIFSLAISANNNLISASSDGQIRLWPCQDFNTTVVVAASHSSYSSKYASHSSNSTVVVAAASCAVKSLLVLDNNKLITAHHDQKIRVYRIEGSESSRLYVLEATLPTFADRARTMMSAKNLVKVRKHVRRTWVHHVDAVSALALSNDAALLYSVSWDRCLKIWRTSDFKCVESISNAHDDAVNAVVVSIDGRVFTGSADRTIKIWRKQTISEKPKHTLLATLTKHISAVNALVVSKDGSVLYSGACDRSIIVWGTCEDGDMVVMGALRGHTKAILCLTVVGDLVISGSADGTIRVWRRSIEIGGGYECLGVFGKHGFGAMKSVVATEVGDGEYLVYGGSLDGEINVWSIKV